VLSQVDKFKHTYILLGNHEFYHNTVSNTIKQAESIYAERSDKITFLNRSSVVVNNTRLIGTTLWSEASEKWKLYVQFKFSDYKVIRKSDSQIDLLTVEDTLGFHRTDVEFIKQEIELAKKKWRKGNSADTSLSNTQ